MVEWEKIVWRMGQWIDFKDGYKTMDLSYMETESQCVFIYFF